MVIVNETGWKRGARDMVGCELKPRSKGEIKVHKHAMCNKPSSGASE